MKRIYKQFNIFIIGFILMSLTPQITFGQTVNLSITGVSGREASSTMITVTATTSSAVTGDQTLDLTISGTNITASDYTLSNAVITIPNGSTTGTVTFTVNNDTSLEGTEIAVLTINNPSSGISLGSTITRQILIYDNDYNPAPVANNEIQLSFVSSYLNVSANPANSAEISAYDASNKRLFIANSLGKKLNIVDISNPTAITPIATIDISAYGNINSVAARNGIVALAIENTDPQANGSVVFMNSSGVFQKQVTVGAMPDMITFNPNGNLVLTANEGEPNSAYTNDPEGSVSIIDISGGIANLSQTNVTTANFNTFDSQVATLRSQGVRIYGLNASVSRDVEPEYITFSADGATAYVTLQENNAIAVLDIATKTITAIRPLGLADHNQLNNGLDASDQGIDINIANLPVKGMYQPDAVASFVVNGTTYLVTANEGDSRSYSGFNEEIRVSSGSYTLDATAFPNASLLKNNTILGRLQVSNRTGDTDGDGDFDEIHVYGSRSYSIWQPTATGMSKVFDSGDQFERIIAGNTTYGAIFNAGHDNNTPKDRSDNKGPEPEGVATATLNGKVYAFVSLERIGGIMVYNVTNPASPVFVQYINSKNPNTVGAGDLGAEGLIFISANDSPTGIPLLVVSNEVSSTISVYSVGGLPIPNTPTQLSASLNNNAKAILNWTDNSNNETRFEVQKSTESTNNFKNLTTLGENATNCLDEDVNLNQTYYYRVRARNDFGVSPFSNVASIIVANIENEALENFIRVFPNPSKGTIHVETTNLEVSKVIVRNALGYPLNTFEMLQEKNLSLHLEGSPKGLYIIEIQTNQGNIRKKIIID